MIRMLSNVAVTASTLAASALAASAVFLVAIALPESAYAQSTDAPLVDKVSFSDLNLSTASGVTLLQHRVKAAISAVCPDADFHEIQAYTAMKRCRRDAAAAAAGQMTAAIDVSQRLAAKDGVTHIASR